MSKELTLFKNDKNTHLQSYFQSIFEKFPELLCFLSDGVDATQDYDVTQMAPWMLEMYQAAKNADPSDEFKASPLYTFTTKKTEKRSIELERTFLCLLTMKAVIEDNYEFFLLNPVLNGQTISQEQFFKLSSLFSTQFSPETLKFLELELVYGDFGKIRPLRDILSQQFSIKHQDPDHFMTALLEQCYSELKVIFPSLNLISLEEFEEFKRINTQFHYGHFFHTECTHRELEKLKDILLERGVDYLYKHFLVQVFDVSGAAAQNQGKILLNQQIFNSYFNDMLPLLESLPTANAEEIYHLYLRNRLILCDIEVPENLPLPQELYLLARLLCMFRIYDAQSAENIRFSIKSLMDNESFNDAIQILMDYQTQTNFPTPTYIPAFLNTLRQSKEVLDLSISQSKEPLEVALEIGMVVIGKALRAHWQLILNQEVNLFNPLNFNKIAGFAKSDFVKIYNLYTGEESFSFSKVDGIIYPNTWIEENKANEAENYAASMVKANGLIFF